MQQTVGTWEISATSSVSLLATRHGADGLLHIARLFPELSSPLRSRLKGY